MIFHYTPFIINVCDIMTDIQDNLSRSLQARWWVALMDLIATSLDKNYFFMRLLTIHSIDDHGSHDIVRFSR